MRILFLGSGEFGLPTLQRLTAGHEVVGVVTQPDRPAGRRRRLTATPIGAFAAGAGLTVLKPESVNEPTVIAQLQAMRADVGVVIAFGQKLSEAVVAACGRLAVNLHASLLPRYRGAAPINWAILNGERETGNTVIGLAQRMDAGVIYARQTTAIDPMETAGELHDRLAAMGPEAIEQVLGDFEADRLSPTVQDDAEATRAPKLSRADGRVDLSASADSVRRRVHGLTPWPGVHVKLLPRGQGEGRSMAWRRVASAPGVEGAEPGTVLEGLRVACGEATAVRLMEIQPEGGRAMSAEDFARGHDLKPGDRFV